MPRVPSYVEEAVNRSAGEKVRFDNATQCWMIYRETSRRIPGKKSPQKIAVDIAICTALGRKELYEPDENKPSIVVCTCWEYGISRVLSQRIPVKWLRYCGENSGALFLDAISKELPDSYLLRGKSYTLPEGINANLRQKSLWERYAEEGITLEVLMPLSTLYMICYTDHVEVMAPNAEQKELLARFGVSLV